ncbi:unnamed protein product, partial [Prorocentrum cordatum]
MVAMPLQARRATFTLIAVSTGAGALQISVPVYRFQMGSILPATPMLPRTVQKIHAGSDDGPHGISMPPDEVDPNSPQAVFFLSTVSKASRWILRLDMPDGGLSDWRLWCEPFVEAKLRSLEWAETERLRTGRTFAEMATDICAAAWRRSTERRRSIVQYLGRGKSHESHEVWERAVARDWSTLRFFRRAMRSYLLRYDGSTVPLAISEHDEDCDGEMLPPLAVTLCARGAFVLNCSHMDPLLHRFLSLALKVVSPGSTNSLDTAVDMPRQVSNGDSLPLSKHIVAMQHRDDKGAIAISRCLDSLVMHIRSPPELEVEAIWQLRQFCAVTSVLVGPATSSLTMLHLTSLALLRESRILNGMKIVYDSTSVDAPATGL